VADSKKSFGWRLAGTNTPLRPRQAGFTLAEVVIATALAALVVGSSIYGYVIASRRAEWSAYSLAANSLAIQRLEQARAAKWDPLGFPPVDELVSTNFPVVSTNVLDIPISKTNIVYATNITTITVLSTNPPLKMIRVDCIWPFLNRGSFTNTVVTYRAPDQ
jgi:prepilin-type N-terminal cleavage/methylation domain-containing protein